MLPPRRPPTWLLLALLACAPAAAVSQEASAQAGAKASFTQEFVDRTAREATEALARAGIRLPAPVPAVLLTAKQAKERRAAFAGTLDEASGMTAGMDLLADFMFSDSMIGRYLTDEKVLYVVDDVLRRVAPDENHARAVLFAVLAHELTHAHDDQVYRTLPDPVKVLAKFKDGDYSELATMQTTMTLFEGHATYASELACRAAGVTPMRAWTMDDVRDSERFNGGDNPLKQGLAVAGNMVSRMKLVQYVQGREFCRQAMDFGGEAFMKEVLTHLPLSANELADFGRFKVRWAAQKEAEEDAAAELPPAAGS